MATVARHPCHTGNVRYGLARYGNGGADGRRGVQGPSGRSFGIQHVAKSTPWGRCYRSRAECRWEWPRGLRPVSGWVEVSEPLGASGSSRLPAASGAGALRQQVEVFRSEQNAVGADDELDSRGDRAAVRNGKEERRQVESYTVDDCPHF